MNKNRTIWLVALALLLVLTNLAGATVGVAQASRLAISTTTNVAGAAQPAPTRPAVAEPPAWHNVYPNYSAIKMLSATNGWVVGDGGVIRHYYNGGWGDYPSPTTANLRGLDVSASEGWAVGDDTILKLVGTDWQSVTSPAPSGTRLLDVDIVAAGEAWAAGISGDYATYNTALLHYINGNWAVVVTPDIPADVNLHHMSCLSRTDCWLAGYQSTNPVVYRYNGSHWTSVPLTNVPPNTPDILSIHMRADNDGWIGMYTYDTSYPLIPMTLLHYNGTDWQPIGLEQGLVHSGEVNGRAAQPSGTGCNTSDFTEVHDIASFGPNDFYIAGASSSSYSCSSGLSGSSGFGVFDHNSTGRNDTGIIRFHALSGVATNDIWVVGEGGGIYHWDGSHISAAIAPINASKVQMLAPNDGWLDRNGDLYHYDGNPWTTQPITTTPNGIYSFAFLTPTDGWAAQGEGGGAYYSNYFNFYHYNGTRWGQTQLINVSGEHISAMQMLSLTIVWAVAEQVNDGDLFGYRYDGSSWSRFTVDNSVSGKLTNLSFDSPTDGWAIGRGAISGTDTPLVYHYSAGSWTRLAFPFNYFLKSVYAVANNDVWLGTNGNNMLHWDGSSWSQVSVPIQNVEAIEMLSPTEGWVGGYKLVEGYGSFIPVAEPLLHYQNGQWQVVAGTDGIYTSISFDSPTDGWALGDHAMRYYPRCTDYYYDVPAGYWAGNAVFYLSCHGIVSGTGNHIFSPDQSATRIQFAKLITLALGWPLITPGTESFTDVPPSNPLYTYVETAHAHGAINGATQAGCQAAGRVFPCFLPNNSITRAQTAIITQQAFGWPNNTIGGPHFSDVATNNYAYTAIETCYNNGLVNGIGGGLFAPNQNVTRAQIAVILYKALTLP